MKTLGEKEKKLNTALNKLINLNLNTNLKENLESLDGQKNQLEIEKAEIVNKYENLLTENEKIKEQLNNYKKQKNNEQMKVNEFSWI